MKRFPSDTLFSMVFHILSIHNEIILLRLMMMILEDSSGNFDILNKVSKMSVTSDY